MNYDIVKLIQKLEEAYPDTVITTRELSSYEQGKQHAQIDIVRYIKSLINNEGED